ncbi:MAG: FAD binding domain-containing protein [Paracoccaceae bacterium]
MVRGSSWPTFLPADVDDFAALYAAHPQATIVAGATDVGLWVTKFLRDISPAIFIGHLDGLKEISERTAPKFASAPG